MQAGHSHRQPPSPWRQSASFVLPLTAAIILVSAVVWYFLHRKRRPLQRVPGSLLRRVKIYTKVGDKGCSSLMDGASAPKSSPCFDVVGTLDELNCNIGHAVEHCKAAELPGVFIRQFEEVQRELFDVGSIVADPEQKKMTADVEKRYWENTKRLESLIDDMELYLPPLKFLILPSGGLAATALHMCRAVCRRCERTMVSYLGADNDVGRFGFIPYMNRLSDYLFTAARLAALNEEKEDRVWTRVD